MNKFTIRILAYLFLLGFYTNAFSQTEASSTSEKEQYSYESSSDDTSPGISIGPDGTINIGVYKNDKSVPAPDPVDDNKGNGTGSSGSGNSSGNSGNNGGSNSNNKPKDNPVSPQDSKNDGKYDKIINNTGSYKHSGNNFEHSGEASEYREGNQSNDSESSYESRSRTYNELISKGNLAKTKILEQKVSIQKNVKTVHDNFSNISLASNYSYVNLSYGTGAKLISDAKANKVFEILNGIAIANQENLFPFISQNLASQNYQLQKSKSEMLKNELQQLFPEIHNNDVQKILQAKKVINNWKLIDKTIGNSTFKDLFIQSESAIQTIQHSIDLVGLDVSNTDLLSTIDKFHQLALYRLEEYISNYSVSINSVSYDLGEEYKRQAIESLSQALEAIFAGEDYVVAADKILEAKQSLLYSQPPYESEGPEDYIAAGVIVGALSKSIVKYGGAKVLKNILTAEDRVIYQRVIREYENLVPGKSICHDIHNPGLLHFIKDDKIGFLSSTFKNETYFARLLEEDEILYRYYDNVNSKVVGRFFSPTPYADSSLAWERLALPQKPKFRAEIKFPKGTLSFEGRAASINYGSNTLVGNGKQIYVDLDNVFTDGFEDLIGENIYEFK